MTTHEYRDKINKLCGAGHGIAYGELWRTAHAILKRLETVEAMAATLNIQSPLELSDPIRPALPAPEDGRNGGGK